MSSINFIGGEKGGVGKSVTARVLAQYFLDTGKVFTGFDTDRSHNSFTRFYPDFASPVVVDSFEGLDVIAEAFEVSPEQNVIVDLAAQTAAPLARWIKDSDLFEVLADLKIAVNFWHVIDEGKDSVNLLADLMESFGTAPNYIVVLNLGRGSDFSLMKSSVAMQNALACGARVIELPQLQDASMRKIDRQNASFWSAVHERSETDGLGMLERQRVKTWLRKAYSALDTLPL
nr:mobilization protein [uncultured Albidiferax sp.]